MSHNSGSMSEAHDEVDELRERAGVEDIEDGRGRRMGNGSVFRTRFLGGSGGCELSREYEPLVDMLEHDPCRCIIEQWLTESMVATTAHSQL